MFFCFCLTLPACILRTSHSPISLFIKKLRSLHCCLLLRRSLPFTPSLQSCRCRLLALWFTGVNSAPHRRCCTSPLMCLTCLCFSLGGNVAFQQVSWLTVLWFVPRSGIGADTPMPAPQVLLFPSSSAHGLLPAGPRWSRPEGEPRKYESPGCRGLGSSCSAQQICSCWHALLCNAQCSHGPGARRPWWETFSPRIAGSSCDPVSPGDGTGVILGTRICDGAL